jgi:hypothetical protein
MCRFVLCSGPQLSWFGVFFFQKQEMINIIQAPVPFIVGIHTDILPEDIDDLWQVGVVFVFPPLGFVLPLMVSVCRCISLPMSWLLISIVAKSTATCRHRSSPLNKHAHSRAL